jgi:hypothetical protein
MRQRLRVVPGLIDGELDSKVAGNLSQTTHADWNRQRAGSC